MLKFDFLFKSFIDITYSNGTLRSLVLIIYTTQPEKTMFKHIIFATVLIANTGAIAANPASSAIISDKEAVSTYVVADNTWAVVAVNSNKGMTKFREFHDMGDAGVQQIDYVVNCSNRKLSMANFQVLTEMNAKTTSVVDRSMADLKFYQPVIQHDINIVDNVCGNRLAMSKVRAVN